MRASRLLSLLMMLQLRGLMSASSLAREFEVSIRTIYRDVDALSAAGVPIYCEPGRNGGVAIASDFRTRLTGLTQAEASALPIAGLTHIAKDLGIASAAASVQLKLMASLPAEAGNTAQQIATRFHIDPTPWYHYAENLEILPSLAEAVWCEKRIAITYESWGGLIKRHLNPLGLVQKGGLWYLVAAVRTSPRTYRVSSIHDMTVLDTAAIRPKRFRLTQYWQTWANDFEQRQMSGRARILITEEGRRILRAFIPAADKIVAATLGSAQKQGWFEAELPYETPDYSARQLLRLGTEVQVLKPEALRRALHREAKAVAKLYMTRSS